MDAAVRLYWIADQRRHRQVNEADSNSQGHGSLGVACAPKFMTEGMKMLGTAVGARAAGAGLRWCSCASSPPTPSSQSGSCSMLVVPALCRQVWSRCPGRAAPPQSDTVPGAHHLRNSLATF